MKNILFFGDSNTYGFKPNGGRYDFTVRYTGRLQVLLGNEYHIIEEGCPGRTTIFEDPNRPYKKGLDYITPCLQSHSPLDYVAVMLGTNDCKSNFHATSKEIALGLFDIIERIKSSEIPPHRILIISPACLGDNTGNPDYDPEFSKASVAVSKGLADEYRLLAQKEGCRFLDAAAVTPVSPIDEQHLDEAGHNRLAHAIEKMITGNAI